MKNNFTKIFCILFIMIFLSCISDTKREVEKTPIEVQNTKKEPRNGEEKYFYPNGILWSTSEYKDGMRHGKTTSYYENGQLRYVGFYKNNEKSGQWFFYNKEGGFEKEINYDSISEAKK